VARRYHAKSVSGKKPKLHRMRSIITRNCVKVWICSDCCSTALPHPKAVRNLLSKSAVWTPGALMSYLREQPVGCLVEPLFRTAGVI
jgi:hypothetical protein